MTRKQIEVQLHEELAVAQLRSGADPDRVERNSELEIALRRYTGFLTDGKIPADLQERRILA